jgi:excisionase family DNA binding protein
MSQKDKPKIITSKEMAQLLGVTRRWVQQLTQDGIITATRVGNTNQYDLIPTIHRYITYLQKKAEENEESTEVTDLQADKLKVEIEMKRAKAQIAALELKELESKMHRSKDVEAMTTDLILVIRSKLLHLPELLASEVASINTAAEVSDRIREAVIDILEDLSDYKYDPKEYEKRAKEQQGWNHEQVSYK